MKCSCGQDLERKWMFCPFCGKKIQKGIKINFPIIGFNKKKKFDDFDSPEDGMDQMNRQVEKMFKAFGFPGKVNIQIHRGKPGQMVPVKSKQQQKQVRTPVKMDEDAPVRVKEMLEPITTSSKTSEGIRFVMQLPGVRGVNDVKVRQFEESIEIKAYAGSRGYFKVIPINPNSEIIDKKFKNEMLKLVIR